MGLWGQMGMPDSGSVLGIETAYLHDHVMFFSVLVFSFVGFLLGKMLVSVLTCRMLLDKQWLEFIWTFLPMGVLLGMGLPSVNLLYVMEDIGVPQITMKAIGHQWYWSYEYCDLGGKNSISFDSYMTPTSELFNGEYRLLEVDNRFVVPYGVPMRVLVSSSDVIHSWAIPSAGVKVDGVPGRVNQVGLGFLSPGVVYGQCSELCGVNHSFMPICGEVVSCETYALWLMPKNCLDLSKGLWDYCSDWGLAILNGLGLGIKLCGELYLGWWKFFGYYFVYAPVAWTVDSTVSVVVGSASSCYDFFEWSLLLLTSPSVACDHAFTKIDGWIESLVMTVIVTPVTSIWYAFGTIGTLAGKLGRGLLELIESAISEMGGPDESHTKRAVCEEVRVWLVRLYRVMMYRFRGD